VRKPSAACITVHHYPDGALLHPNAAFGTTGHVFLTCLRIAGIYGSLTATKNFVHPNPSRHFGAHQSIYGIVTHARAIHAILRGEN
jgi:hypothetical protein